MNSSPSTSKVKKSRGAGTSPRVPTKNHLFERTREARSMSNSTSEGNPNPDVYATAGNLDVIPARYASTLQLLCVGGALHQ